MGYTFKIQTNGCRINIDKSWFDKRQKSYDVMINNGKDNCWYKIGIIRDIETLNKILSESEEK